MKTRMIKLSIVLFFVCAITRAQEKESIAIISIDTKGLMYDNLTLASLVRLELEKTDVYEVKDKYDVANIVEENNINVNKCFGKTKQVEVGQILDTDKMLTGSAEKFGEKIIFILRLVDVKTESIEKTSVMEYLNQEDEIQHMVQISISKLLDLSIDPNIENLLVDYERPITSAKTRVKLNGPRMGATMTFGETAEIIQAPENIGGFDSYPIASMFGYQYEVQYLSAGDFQALIEFIGAINGLETGNVVPSLSFLNGFRFNKGGWEIGLGPTFRATQIANGFYDNNGNWFLENEMPEGANYPIERRLDSRGEVELSTGLIIAVGKTFRSGYLNIPVNLYISPKKEGAVVGMSFGFNIAKNQKSK